MDCRTQPGTMLGLLARLDSSSDGHHTSCGTERIIHMKFRVHRRRSVVTRGSIKFYYIVASDADLGGSLCLHGILSKYSVARVWWPPGRRVILLGVTFAVHYS
ncbi:MAG: hypothetical protein ACK56F_30555 [bacterium]